MHHGLQIRGGAFAFSLLYECQIGSIAVLVIVRRVPEAFLFVRLTEMFDRYALDVVVFHGVLHGVFHCAGLMGRMIAKSSLAEVFVLFVV